MWNSFDLNLSTTILNFPLFIDMTFDQYIQPDFNRNTRYYNKTEIERLDFDIIGTCPQFVVLGMWNNF